MESKSRDEVRRIDRCAIETVGVNGLVLMENAGRQTADAVCELLGGAEGKSVAIVAGAGNNAGDGFVVARHLGLRGARVATFLVVPREKVSGDAAENLAILERLDHEVVPLADRDELANLSDRLTAFDLIVDAVGGTGIRGELRGGLAQAVQQINTASGAAGETSGDPKDVVAVDIPTGLDCDTGEPAGDAVRATLTVTYAARKKGFDAPGAAACTGEVRLADIGIPAEQVAEIAAREDASD